MRLLRAMLMGSCVLVGSAGLCGAQAQRQDSPTQPEQDRAALRQRLERRLSELDRLHERLEGAIKQLDSGAPLESVRNEVFPPGEMRRPDRGPDRRETGGERPPGSGRDERGPGLVRHDLYGPPDPDAERRMVLRFLDEHDQAGAQRLRDVLRDRPEDGARWLGRSTARIRTIMEERDDDLRALRIQEFRVGRWAIDSARRLGDALAALPPDTGAAEMARADLARALGEQFDIRVKLHEREIAVLEERLGQLKADLAKQEGQRDHVVETGTEEILRRIREWSERDRNRTDGSPPPQR